MANGKADIPEQGEKALDRIAKYFLVAFVQKNQQVDIGIGVQFAASVTAHRHQRDIGVFAPLEALPCGAQHLIDKPGPILHQSSNVPAGQKALIENLARVTDDLLEGGNGAGLEGQLRLELATIEELGVNLRHAMALHQGSDWEKIRPRCALWCRLCAA